MINKVKILILIKLSWVKFLKWWRWGRKIKIKSEKIIKIKN